METCGELTGRGRESCFAQFGCSSDRVTTYFSAVEAMERAFEREGECALMSVIGPGRLERYFACEYELWVLTKHIRLLVLRKR